ncbi:MAG: DUF2461 domain-containing protein [Actinomycetota bacterium]|nr:DUF2461 domain-containing protein [Actinomycetota bacterium]
MPFAGFPEQALVSYEGLLADNTKTYWSDHRAVYDGCVARPLRALLDDLGPEFGEAKVLRPSRDVRFSRDKTPYKTKAAAVVQEGSDVGQGLYLALSADGLEVGGGFHHTGPGQVQRLQPKPWDAGHPRADLLRLKTLTAVRRFEPEDWLHTPEALHRVAAGWRRLEPLLGWLREHLGPSRVAVRR